MRESQAVVQDSSGVHSPAVSSGPTDVIVVAPGDELLLAIGPAIDERYRLKSCETLQELAQQISPNRPAVVIVGSDALPEHSDGIGVALQGFARVRAIVCVPDAARPRWEQARIRGVVTAVLASHGVSTDQYSAAIRSAAAVSATSPTLEPISNDAGVVRASIAAKRWIIPVAVFAMLLVAGVAWWLNSGDLDAGPTPVAGAPAADTNSKAAPAPSLADRSITSLLSDARLAFSDRRYFDGDTSALSIYKAVLAREPENGEALDGMQRLESVMFNGAEADLAAGRVDEAYAAVAALKANWPTTNKISQLEDSLVKERQRVLTRRAREAIGAGDFAVAAKAIEDLESTRASNSLMTQLRRELDQKIRVADARAASEQRAAAEAREKEAASQRAQRERDAAREREQVAAREAELRTRAAPPVAAAPVEPVVRQPISLTLSDLKANRKVPPEYPQALMERGVSSQVEFELAIDDKGVVRDVVITKRGSAKEFDEAVIAAFKRWRFAPYLENGAPVAVKARGRINFKPA